jgi:hypothetical protein
MRNAAETEENKAKQSYNIQVLSPFVDREKLKKKNSLTVDWSRDYKRIIPHHTTVNPRHAFMLWKNA